MPLSPAMMTRSGCMWPRPAAAVSTRSFSPSFNAAFASAGAEHRKDIFDVFGRGAEFAQDRADGLALFDDDEMLAPVAAADLVFGRSVMFSGTTRASKPI